MPGTSPAMTMEGGCGRLARRARFRFPPTPNQWLRVARPVPARGAYRDRHERGAGCGGRESVGAQEAVAGRVEPRERRQGAQDERRFARTAKPCGPDTRCWCQVGGDLSDPTGSERSLDPPMTVTRRIRRRGDHGISRKAITQGMPGASAEPVCSCAPSSPLRMRPRVQRAPGIPCAL